MTPSGCTTLILASRMLAAQPPPARPPGPWRTRRAQLCLAIIAAAAAAAGLTTAYRRTLRRTGTRPGIPPAAGELPRSRRLRRALTRVDVWILITTAAGVVIAFLALARSR